MAKVDFTTQKTFEKHTGYLFWIAISLQSSGTDQLDPHILEFFKIFLENINPFCGITDTPVLVTSALGFIARVDPLLALFVAHIQWIPQIHLWCDTC